MLKIYLSAGAFIFTCFYWWLPDRARLPLLASTGLAILAATDCTSFIIFCAVLSWVQFTTLQLGKTAHRKAWFWIAITGIASPLVYFKLTKENVPLGLSYYSLTFMGVFIDSYRRVIEVSPLRLFYFSTFFPVFAAGPVERFGRLNDSLFAPKVWKNSRSAEAAYLISLGLFKKFVVADRLAPFIQDPQRNYLNYVGVELWMYLTFALIQVFSDFSGIIDIVRGFSKLLGVDVIDNFNQPYFASSIPDIWRRWHISLVDWLRDFVYSPIALRTRNLYFASFVVMLLVGLWHEVTFHRIFWATYWALLFSGSICIRRRYPRASLPKWLAVFLACIAMTLSALFLIPENTDEARRMAQGLLNLSGTHFADFIGHVAISRSDMIVSLAGFLFVIASETFDRWLRKKSKVGAPKNLTANWCAIACLIVFVTAIWATGDSQAFIYLRY